MRAASEYATSPEAATAIPFDLGWARNTLGAHWLQPLDALVVTKSCAGFDQGVIGELRHLLSTIAHGELMGLKYLIYDFAHPADASKARASEGFEELLAANAGLILEAPVITIAWARTLMGGADLDFALYCSSIIAESSARFSFEGDPQTLLSLYSGMARKIGFVKAERLLEGALTLNAADMLELSLVKEVVEPEPGFAAFEHYVARSSRRYNASCAMFRAQRIAMAPVKRRG
jgi:enoyl-CoA hydratase/carnithine racemase